MPSQAVKDGEPPEIRVKIAYSGEVFITSIAPGLVLAALLEEIRGVCKFDLHQAYTIKWVDEEGDPCTISSQRELDEALRLYEVNKDSELTMHGEYMVVQKLLTLLKTL
ncbi:PB1 domain [Trinorchestia longiramus]|nr:PB1 domain [Trinorchestia longiramus]